MTRLSRSAISCCGWSLASRSPMHLPADGLSPSHAVNNNQSVNPLPRRSAIGNAECVIRRKLSPSRAGLRKKNVTNSDRGQIAIDVLGSGEICRLFSHSGYFSRIVKRAASTIVTKPSFMGIYSFFEDITHRKEGILAGRQHIIKIDLWSWQPSSENV